MELPRIVDGLDSPRVAIVVLNWHGWSDTIECLESVFRQDYPNYQVVVCDNASRDGSFEKILAWAAGELPVEGPGDHPLSRLVAPPVRKPIRVAAFDAPPADGAAAPDAPLVLIRTGGNLGFAGGNNVGMRFARRRPGTKYIWLLNNDTVVDAAARRRMVEEAERDPRVAMVGSKLMDYERPGEIQTIGGGWVKRWRGLTDHIGAGEEDEGQWEERFDPDYITGASLLASAAAIDEIGEMDESYFLYSEEVDWCLRARRRRFALRYSPGSVVWHKGGRSVGYGSSLHDYHTVRSMLLLVRNFYPHLLPITFVYSLGRCLAPKIARLQYDRFRAVLRAYRDFFTESTRRGARKTPAPKGPPRAFRPREAR